MGSGSVQAEQLADGAVTGRSLASGSIGWQHMAPEVRDGLPTPMLAPLTQTLSSRVLLGETTSTSGVIAYAPERGLYRASVYTVVVEGCKLNAANLSTRLDWVDDAGTQTDKMISEIPLATSGAVGHSSTVVQCCSGAPIIFTVSLGSIAGPPKYNAYGVVERLI